VLEHFRSHPKQSLGVIAFNLPQQMRILDELERLRREHPEFEEFFRENRDEPFFVKNLENVQGDERDVIFLSVGYGPDETGRVAMRFGPLNRQGGERRLNVAVTRARFAMRLASSLRAHDIDLSRTNAVGVRLLRAYLDYAERGTIALLGAITEAGTHGFESSFEQEVFEELTRRGLTIHPQVGCSSFRIDLAIVDPHVPGRYVLGVECDGAAYHSSATARDRDRLRQEVLESLGWRFCRIWSTDWLRNREDQVRRVFEALDQACRKTPTPPTPERPISAEVNKEATPLSSERPPVTPRPAATHHFDSIDEVPDKILRDLLLEILQMCGATPEEELVRAVRGRLGFERTGSRIQERVATQINELLRLKRISRGADGRLQITSSQPERPSKI
jgi:very-short-patch-repair endonuclease